MLEYGLVALIIFSAGIVRGFTGFGFVLAAAPLLAFIFPPILIVPVVLLLDMSAGLHASLKSRRNANMRLVVLLSLPSLLLAPFGALLLGQISEDMGRLCIGIIVLAAIPGLLLKLRLKTDTLHGEVTAIGTGGLSGLMNGAFGLGGPPIGLFMASSALPVNVMRATTIVYFLIADTGSRD